VQQRLCSLPGLGLLRSIKRRLTGAPASEHYRLIGTTGLTTRLVDGWKDETIPFKQRQIVNVELAQMRAGQAPLVFQVAAEAMHLTGCRNPTVLEIGCSSGYYSDAIEYLLGRKVRYVGLDYSLPLVQLGRATYPQIPFLNGDATRLPFADATWDVVISGCVLLHVPDWQAAAAETVRVAQDWCIFHRTPVGNGPTTLMAKLAYGVEVMEWLFNESEFVELIRRHGCTLTSALSITTGSRIEGITDNLSLITYLFRKESCASAQTASPAT